MIDGGLRKLFRQYLPQAMWVTVETSSTESGVPDSFYCFPKGICGWIEYKVIEHNAVGLRPGQVAWHERYARMGGRSFIAVRRHDELHIFKGCDVRKLKSDGCDGVAYIKAGVGGPANWHWWGVQNVLKKAI